MRVCAAKVLLSSGILPMLPRRSAQRWQVPWARPAAVMPLSANQCNGRLHGRWWLNLEMGERV